MPLTRKLASKSLIKQNTNQDTVGTGVTNLTRDAFTGTGSQTIFTLTSAPLSSVNTQVFISGVYQNKSNYTVTNTTLTFSVAPPAGTLIEVISGTNYSIGIPGDSSVTNAKLANMNNNTIKGNNTGASAAPVDLTQQNVRDMLYVAPTRTTLTSGSGTYNTPTNCKYIKVRMVGGGAGGAGGFGTGTGTGGNGGSTTFGSLTANGGTGGVYGASSGGAGGTAASIPSGWSGFSVAGGSGSGAAYWSGGCGGSSAFGGAGGAGWSSGTGFSGIAGALNTGSGGGGGGGNSGTGGSGGGAGAYIEVISTSLLSSYSYSVGTGGAAGSSVGAAGGSGVIIVEEYYQ